MKLSTNESRASTFLDQSEWTTLIVVSSALSTKWQSECPHWDRMLELRGQHEILYRRENSLQYLGDPTVHSDQSSASPGDHHHEYHYSLQGRAVGKHWLHWLQTHRYSQLQTIWRTQQQVRSSREPSLSLAQQGETSGGLTVCHRHSPTFLELPPTKTGSVN